MGRRRSSGFLETLVKSVFGTGTTVRRSRDWAGRKVTTVKHYDSGKTKKYVHGTGLCGNTTRTVTRNANGQVTERGKVRKTFLGATVEKAQKTQSRRKVKRKYGQGLSGNKMKTVVSSQTGERVGSGVTKPSLFGKTRSRYTGTCFGCDGTGLKSLECHKCDNSGVYKGECRGCEGTGTYQPAAKNCWSCDGSGKTNHSVCGKCGGTGLWTPRPHTCRKCSGTGLFSAKCRKCDGMGRFTVKCKRCDGTGVFQKRS